MGEVGWRPPALSSAPAPTRRPMAARFRPAAASGSPVRPTPRAVVASAAASDPPPLLAALLARAATPFSSFHVPGHKRGAAAGPLGRALDKYGPWGLDFTELEGLDVLSAPTGAIAASQTAVAAAYGVAASRLLVNGATVGVHAAVLATCAAGAGAGSARASPSSPLTLLATRAAHQCAAAGAALAGASVAWLDPPAAGAAWGWLAHPPTAAAVAAGLEAAAARGDAVGAVLIVSPTYYGAVADVDGEEEERRGGGERAERAARPPPSLSFPGIAAACAAAAVPLIVDAAHGAHFGLHPAFPAPAARPRGADPGVLAAASAHKTLATLTQAALLHASPVAVSSGLLARADGALRLLQSSSPSYLLMAASESGVAAGAAPGAWDAPLAAAAACAQVVRAASDWALLADEEAHGAGVAGWDPLRLTLRREGRAGHALAAALEAAGAVPEMATDAAVVLALGAGSGEGDARALERALAVVSPTPQHAPPRLPRPPPPPPVALSPRDALFGAWEAVPLSAAAGRVAAEAIVPYPPGVPALAPGDRCTEEALAWVVAVAGAGGRVVCADPGLATIRVVVE